MSAEDRVRTAAEATAAAVREIRPLTLPDSSAASAERRGHRGRAGSRLTGTFGKIKETWIIPLGAAAAVAALALALVTLRHAEAPAPPTTNTGTPSPPVAGIPRYYAIASEGKESHEGKAAISVTVADVYTGKAIATVATPATYVGGNSAVAGVSATADDRTFVVGSRNIYGGVAYYLVHVTPGGRQVATIAPVPVPQVAVGNLLGFAVSPDGKELAVLSVRGNGTTLRTYSVKSGATLRTWTASTWQYQGIGIQQAGVSWTADSRQVAFSTAVGGTTYSGVLDERLIGATAPDGDLATASKLVFKAPGNCSSVLLTPDGGTVVCATMVNYPPATSADPHPGSPGVCGEDGPMFVAYSAATGKRLRVLYQYTGTCDYGVDTVLWTDDSARHVIGESRVTFRGNSFQYFDNYGVAAAGQFAQFSIGQHGQWYSGPAF
jgi:hypothetical protein